MLRKATVEVIFGENLVENFPFEMNSIEKMECFRIIRFGEKRATGLVRIKMKPERHPSEISKNKNFLRFEVLNKNEDKYLCVVRKNFSKILKKLVGDPDLFSKRVGDGFFYDMPMEFNGKKVEFSVIGTQESIDGYLSILEEFQLQYKLKSVKDYNKFEGIKDTDLTDKQMEIVSTAFELGYYNNPRKIGSDKLAEIFEITQPTLLEHLRKAEKKIMRYVFG